nr:maleylpyruvate isomerase N-terminal domain-containing protein [Kibdelosporangium sp. MJ126-NF4]CEL19862.1 Ribosomal-protein-alanine acetyltransferase [Kibdelosporangium sp. MJ126-NF4]CTQ97086.1 Ribosomal-protein-alanine acetyltransferase (EC 2.3.1.128) [Kibdelosporangium sp. MJ126-NF4]
MTVTADDLDAAIASVVTALSPVTDRDWSTAAGTGDWDCWHTAEHLGDCLLSYAAQLIALPATRYVRFLASVDKDASAAEVLEFAMTGTGMLSSAVRTAAPSARAYHPTGTSDPEGFAGMGCVEALVHGEDMARGLGVTIDPPRDMCARVLARMFPHTTADLTSEDPWTALLWATDRLELPGHPRQEGWRWRGSPLD